MNYEFGCGQDGETVVLFPLTADDLRRLAGIVAFAKCERRRWTPDCDSSIPPAVEIAEMHEKIGEAYSDLYHSAMEDDGNTGTRNRVRFRDVSAQVPLVEAEGTAS